MNRFLTPRWLASHLFVIILIVSFVVAGFWQIDRLGERKDTNSRIEARMDEPALPVQRFVDMSSALAEYRLVDLTGNYLDREVYVANRSDDGLPGSWAWTPFLSDDGIEIIINRGFVSRAILQENTGAVPLTDTAAPTGEVRILGRIRQGLDDGRLSEDRTELARPDAVLAASVLDLVPTLDPRLYVELIEQSPPTFGDFPNPLPAPDLGAGPHLSYAFQWFTFATLGVLGYSMVLRRIRRGDESRGDVPHLVD